MIGPIFVCLALFHFKKYSLLGKNLPNFVSVNLKFHNQYCHDHRKPPNEEMFLDYFKKKKDAGTKCSRFLVDSYCKLRRVYFHLYGSEFESCKVEEYIAMNSKKSVEKTHTCPYCGEVSF